MKYGVEVEGYLSGVRTLFCQVEEIPRLLSDEIKIAVKQHSLSHIYICDHGDTLTEDDVISIREKHLYLSITIETLGIPKVKLGPHLASYMVNIPFEGTAQLAELSSSDQIKLTNGLHVMTVSGAFSMGTQKVRVGYTYPEDFAGDIEL